MKRTFILVLTMVVLLSLISISQSKSIPDGFIGLKWGHSLDKMREEKLLYSIKVEDYDPDRITAIVDLRKFNPFPELSIKGIALTFYKDKLYGGSIMLENFKDWDFLSRTLKEKYGDPLIEKMKNAYGNSIGIILIWNFGIGKGVITARFNQVKEEGDISYDFSPKELKDRLSSQEEKERSRVKDKF